VKNKVLTRRLDKLGRITIPANLRKSLNINDFEELEIISGANNIIIRNVIIFFHLVAPNKMTSIAFTVLVNFYRE